MPGVLQEARALPAAWPVCLRATGVLLLALVCEGEGARAERLLYCPCSMYLAVLSARAAKDAVRLNGDAASTAWGQCPYSRLGYRCEQFGNWRTARCTLSQRGTPWCCRRARWQGGCGSVALRRP